MANKETQIQKQESKDLQSIERTRWGKVFTPPVDIIETDNELKLYADMPGTDKESINITVDQNILTVRGNVDVAPVEGYELEYAEYEVGDYQRSFTLNDTINQEKIEANYDNGVLELTLPKAEKAKPMSIKVK